MISRFLVLFIFAPIITFALNMTPDGIKAAVSAACDEVIKGGLHSSQFDYWNAGQFKAKNFSQMVSAISHESLVSSIQLDFIKENTLEKLVVASDGYRQGLIDCGIRNREVSLFLDHLIKSSAKKGKIVGAVALVTIFRGVGGLSARLSQYIGFLSQWINKASTGFNYVLLASLLKADSPVQEKTQTISVTDLDLKKQQDKNITEFQQLSEDLLIVRKKIEACGKCSDAEMLQIYSATILEALKTSKRSSF